MDQGTKRENDRDRVSKKEKQTQEERMNELEIKNKEKAYLEEVFAYLCDLEKEASSDDGTKLKKYHKGIEENANKKKMRKQYINFKSKTAQIGKKQQQKKYEEDSLTENNSLYKDPETEESKIRAGRFGKKALRKAIRRLTDTFDKDEIRLMIWEVDSNLDGYVTFNEYENMYKRCLLDEKEREPKKLYYLIQFLMFDKEQKGYITVEDTLEILCVTCMRKQKECQGKEDEDRDPRTEKGIDSAIDSIFDVEEKDAKGKKVKKKNETLTYLEFAKRMHSLSLKKRTQLMNKKKIFCEQVKQQALGKKCY
jgi:Ca2+-binding EF-hand superfamily protein